MKKITLFFSNKFRDIDFQQRLAKVKKTDCMTVTAVIIGVALAILIRSSLIGFESLDYTARLSYWYNFIKSNGSSAFGINFSRYSPPYLYLLWLIVQINPNTPPLIGVKIPGLISDFVCAYYVYRIVQVKSPSKTIPFAAGIAVLFAPTVIVNSAFWGQADSIYTAALIACLYYLIIRKNTFAMIAYGSALAIKLQAIFLAPLLFALLLRRALTWKQMLFIPLILFLSLVPAWIAGRPIADLLSIYPDQSSEFELLTMNAPSIYTWIPDTKAWFNLFYIPGVIAGAIAAFLLVFIIFKSRAALTEPLTLELALVSVMLIPFFLPKMHERFFFPADVISIVFAFYFPQFFFIPIAMNAISFMSYEPYLFGIEPVPFPILTLGLLIAISILIRNAIRDLYSVDISQAVPMDRIKGSLFLDYSVLVIGIGLAVAIRYSLLGFRSVDFLAYTRHWYSIIRANGFSAFGRNFSNYNPPYLYLLYPIATFFPHLPKVVAIKFPSLIADFISAGLAYKIVRLKYSGTPVPWIAIFAVLFAPTVVLNSAFWGQADALYTAALLASIYFLLIRKPALAILFFAISLSFKAQALFLFPLLFVLFLKKEIPWKDILIIPLIMVLVLVPAWIAGRPLPDLLQTYLSQAGQYQQLSMHAPSLLALIPNWKRFYGYFYSAGLILAAAAGLALVILIHKSRAKLTPALLVELSLISVLLMPFFLPEMHERYFYPADILSILFAFYFPNYFYIPIGMSIVSFFAYQPTLFNVEPVPVGILTIAVFTIIIILIRDVIFRLYAQETVLDATDAPTDEPAFRSPV